MPYPAMPSRLMPIDADGTVAGQASSPLGPVTSYPAGASVIAWVAATVNGTDGGVRANTPPNVLRTSFFFPETRQLLGLMLGMNTDVGSPFSGLRGSNDTANGDDGTWEAASLPAGYPAKLGSYSTIWRSGVVPVTFTNAKTVVQFDATTATGATNLLSAVHLYGVKGSGQTPDDMLFLDGDTSFAEYTVDKDFGDRPLGTTVVKQFKLKNSSATKTANSTVVTCNDTDFAISTDGTTYVTSFTIASLGPGVSSAVLYIRNTTPSPGAALGPRMVRLSAAVGSYS